MYNLNFDNPATQAWFIIFTIEWWLISNSILIYKSFSLLLYLFFYIKLLKHLVLIFLTIEKIIRLSYEYTQLGKYYLYSRFIYIYKQLLLVTYNSELSLIFNCQSKMIYYLYFI
jgi:hypothetical protein